METIVFVLGLVSITGLVCHAYTAKDRLEHRRRMREIEYARERRMLSLPEDGR